jgi:class 3 adenylate cyclase
LVVYLAVSFWLAGGYAIMLRGLRNAMQAVTHGEIATKLPERGRGLGRSTAEQFNQMVRSIRKKLALQKYVSQSTSKMIEDLTTGEYVSDASRRDVTVFFSDIRNFTPYAEENDPLDVVDTLNAVFALQVEAIVNHSGDIDKFIGDEVMAVFPGPSEAFQAAVKIQQKMKSFNRGRKVPLHVGIGIHSGEAVLGAVGAGDFYNYTTIGNTVNVGKRICSAAEPGSILMSEEAFEQTKISRKHTQRELKIKGIRKRMQVRVFT